MEIHVPYVTSGKHRAVAKMFRHPGLATTRAASDGNQELKKKIFIEFPFIYIDIFKFFEDKSFLLLLLFKVLILLPILSTLTFCCLLLRSKG
jgi:hypothetical protein